MPYARRKASGTRFRGVGQPGEDAVFGRQVVAPPLNWDVTTVTTRALLDRVQDGLLAGPDHTGEAMYDLQSGLHEIKSRSSAAEWERVAAECVAHPVGPLLWQDPFTRHSYERPSGYAGDARLLDYLYGVAGAPAGTTARGASVFGHMMSQQGACWRS